MGETEFWDEFINPETGSIWDGQISFNESFDPLIAEMSKVAENMNLIAIASSSGPGGIFDIKNKYPNKGALLFGKYATSRSAGNYLAGFNASTGTVLGIKISFDTFQRLAGALHVKRSLSILEKVDIVLAGVKYGAPPTYGEVPYQHRMSIIGWHNGIRQKQYNTR